MPSRESRQTRAQTKKPMPPTPSLPFALILGCFFISGITGLMYEVLWTRMIVKIIGSSPFAVSIVLTVFMGGLGLGSYLAGRTIDRVKEPAKLVRIYGVLELCIGSYAFVLPVLLAAFKPLYAILYNHLFDYFLAYSLLTFVGCSLLLIVPVTCMGATLPILSRFYVTSLSRVGTRVGRLYGLNTIGAALGSLLCGFWLVNLLGVWGNLLLAVVLNGMIGAVAILVGAEMLGRAAPWKETQPAEARRDEARSLEVPGTGRSSGSYALAIFAVSGFCAMAYEVIWIKLLGLIVGPTTYSFTIVLVTFITGLALGAMFFGWLGDRVKNTMMLLVAAQIAAGVCALAFSQIMGNSQVFFAKLIYEFRSSFAFLSLIKAIVLFVAMLPPTFFLGATFPLVGKIYTTSLSHTGRSIGFAYAVNSVGAVLGSFCAGFVLIPFVGKEHGLSLVIALQLLTAVFVGARESRKVGIRILRWSPLVIVGCVGALLLLRYPHWNRKMLSKGIYHSADRVEIESAGWLEALFAKNVTAPGREKEELLYYGDGVGGFTTVLRSEALGDTAYALCNSGKADASFPGDMTTQTLFAHFAMLFHPHARNVLVVGLASGVTAGEVLNYPVERLDVVDINEKVVSASRYFRKWNSDVVSDSRTRLIIQDGRAHLAMTEEKYDVISSEPSNPWMAGLASLFTKEVFELAKHRLNDGGMFVQFAHAYQMDWRTFAMIGRTFADVFPNSFLVNTEPTADGPDYLLIGIKGDRKLDASVAAGNLKYARRSTNIDLPDHRLFYNMIVTEDLRRLFGEGRVHSENRPYLEYAAPKLVFMSDPAIRRSIVEKKRLSQTTLAIVEENRSSVDRRIDFAAYALSLYSTAYAFTNRVDLSAATEGQRQRFTDLLADYCGKNVVPDVFALEDAEIRERCVFAQKEMLRTRMTRARDRGPFLKQLGEMCSREGKLDEAVEYFTQALRLKPDDVEARNNLGNVLAKQKKYDASVDQYRAAIRLAPRNAITYNNLGCTLSEQGRAAEAIECFSEALKLNPDFADAHYNMGKALASQGKLDGALGYFAAAVRLKPGYAAAHNDLADALVEQGKREEAIEHYRAAVRIDPGYALARYGLGSALAAEGKTEEAIEQYSKAVELAPDYVKALNALAWTLATDGDPRFRNGPRAVALAERACSLSGGRHPLLLDTLAAAYAESGEFGKAAQTAQRAIALARAAGRQDWAQDIEKRLGLYSRGLSFRAGL